MILYHAGPQWVHVTEALTNRTDLAKMLCEDHGFTQCTLYEPFGRGRGAVIAKRDHMLVMSLETDGGVSWYAIAPSKDLQDLIWSFSNGFAGQWSVLELKVMTGHESWNAVLQMAGRQFSEAVQLVEQAIAGPMQDPAAVEPPSEYFDDALEVPADYLHSLNGSEVVECVH